MEGPLETRQILRSTDPDAVRKATGGLTVPHEIVVRRRDQRIDGVVNGAQLDRANVVFVRYGTSVEVEAPGTGGRIAMTIPLGPMGVAGAGAASVRTRGFVLNEESPTLMRPEPHAGALVIATDRGALERQLHVLTGSAPSRPLRFDASAGEPPMAATAIDATWRWAVAQLESVGDAPLSRAVRRHLEDTLLNAMLLGHRHSASALLTEEPDPADEDVTAIERARRYIDDHFHEPISTTTLAHEVGASARYLQAGFRRRYDATPTEVLLEVRLRHARSALLEQAARRERSVTQVALSSGFAHLGRFARQYRERFGESPSQTTGRQGRSRR